MIADVEEGDRLMVVCTELWVGQELCLGICSEIHRRNPKTQIPQTVPNTPEAEFMDEEMVYH